MRKIAEADPELARIMVAEIARQQSTINLIASENYASLAVLEAGACVFSNKYSEGYPNKRYYAGNKYVDESESLAIKRAKQLFGADHANVQPHAGSQANLASYLAILKKGDKILSMALAHGGHLTHGSPVNLSGKLWQIAHYGVQRDTGRIDMEQVRRLALKERPRLIVAGATAYPREIDFEGFAKIAKEVKAYLLVDMAHIAGLVAAGVHVSPVPFADIVTTTTHKTLRGPRGGIILCRAGLAKQVDKAVFPGTQGGPLEHMIAAKALALKEAMADSFKQYGEQIVKNAKALAAKLTRLGFELVSGGTDNHLMLVDLRNKGITGKQAQLALEQAGITVNKNMVPFDTGSPFNPSGIRLGTPALTTRGFKEKDMEDVAEIIADVLEGHNAGTRVEALCRAHPLYPELGHF